MQIFDVFGTGLGVHVRFCSPCEVLMLARRRSHTRFPTTIAEPTPGSTCASAASTPDVRSGRRRSGRMMRATRRSQTRRKRPTRTSIGKPRATTKRTRRRRTTVWMCRRQPTTTMSRSRSLSLRRSQQTMTTTPDSGVISGSGHRPWRTTPAF